MPKTKIPMKEISLISMTTTKDEKYVAFDKALVKDWTLSPVILYAETTAKWMDDDRLGYENRDLIEEWLEENCTGRYTIEPIYSNRSRSYNHYGHRESGKAHRKKATNYDKKTYKTRRHKVANDQDFLSITVRYYFEVESDATAFAVFAGSIGPKKEYGLNFYLRPRLASDVKDRSTFKVQPENPWGW